MRPEEKKLWSELEGFDIDGGEAALSFERRLANENGWSLPYARRVVREYKRFVFLACTAGHPVTPPEDVDQAWHLHMTYTDSYWSRLCGEILGRPLAHNPTKGGADEGAKFHRQYRRTLESYANAFGEPAPADIWPAPDVRFSPSQRYVRVNLSDHWVLPKASVRRAIIGGAAMTLAGAAAGCGVAASDLEPLWIILGIVLFGGGITWAILHAALTSGNRPGSGGSGSGCGSDGGSSGCGSGCGGGCGGGCGS